MDPVDHSIEPLIVTPPLDSKIHPHFEQDPNVRLQMWEITVENANDPILITTVELDFPGPHIVYVNLAFTRVTGYTAEEFLGKTPRILQGPLTEHAETGRMRFEFETGRSFVGETINYTKAGESYFME